MNNVANELLHRIGHLIINDPSLEDDWTKVECVFKYLEGGVLEEQCEMWVSDDEQIAFLLADEVGEISKSVRQFHAATVNDDGTEWLACKIDIERETLQIKVKFEYEDQNRWDESLPI